MAKKKLGVFYNGRYWLMGEDEHNGACCETKEIAEQLLTLHNKYYYKKVKFTFKGERVEGRVTECGLLYVKEDPIEVEPTLYIRYKNGKWRVKEADCELI